MTTELKSWEVSDKANRWRETAQTWLRKAVAIMQNEHADPSGYWRMSLLYHVLDSAESLAQMLPDDKTDTFEFEFALAYAEKIVAHLHSLKATAKRDALIAKLEQVTGRTPEEAAEFQRKAAELRAR